MNPQELKARLERALHTRIASAEWAFLNRVGLIHEYEIGLSAWSELRGGVRDNLEAIREFRDDDLRERTGELEEEPREKNVYYQTEDVPVDPDDRTFARYLALDALNRLRSGGSAPERATMQTTLLPRGGVDGTVPQWVHVTAAELWMPAEEVARAFRAMQQTLMIEPGQPKTQARAFNVARFVWEIEAAHGERLRWPEMCKRWNDSPMTRPFEHWRDFHTYFRRGEKATLPHYKATDEAITEQVRVATARGEAVAFDEWVRDVRAATVRQHADKR